VQSMVRDEAKRGMLFELDTALQELGKDNAKHPSVVKLMGVYHNLIRLWSDT